VSAGQVVIADAAVLLRRDPDAFHADHERAHSHGDKHSPGAPSPSPSLSLPPYILSRPVLPDAAMLRSLHTQLSAECGAAAVSSGTNVTACSFYSSQARVIGQFDDRNDALLGLLAAQLPQAMCMEMESFQLWVPCPPRRPAPYPALSGALPRPVLVHPGCPSALLPALAYCLIGLTFLEVLYCSALPFIRICWPA
jgi:hypothetical protein